MFFRSASRPPARSIHARRIARRRWLWLESAAAKKKTDRHRCENRPDRRRPEIRLFGKCRQTLAYASQMSPKASARRASVARDRVRKPHFRMCCAHVLRKEYYLRGNCIIFVSGKLPENLIPKLNQYFGKWTLNKNQSTLPKVIAQPSSQKKFRIDNDVNAVQGAIRIATPFPNQIGRAHV